MKTWKHDILYKVLLSTTYPSHQFCSKSYVSHTIQYFNSLLILHNQRLYNLTISHLQHPLFQFFFLFQQVYLYYKNGECKSLTSLGNGIHGINNLVITTLLKSKMHINRSNAVPSSSFVLTWGRESLSIMKNNWIYLHTVDFFGIIF